MSNSAILVDNIPAQIGMMGPIEEYQIYIDTTATNLTISTPAVSTNRLFVVGIWLASSNAANITFQSINGGTTNKQQTFQLSANQALPGFMTNGFYFATLPGDSLVIQSSATFEASLGDNLILRVVEGLKFRVN